ncbi:MAG: OmpA family protein [Burkholderiaceae bacterium]
MLEPVAQEDPLPAQWQGRKRRLALASAGSKASVASAEPERPSAGSDPVLPRLTFFQGSARLTKQARAALRKLSRQLKAAPGARFVIAGHTDDRGGSRLNQRLSRDRAKAALAFLVAQGCPAIDSSSRAMAHRSRWPTTRPSPGDGRIAGWSSVGWPEWRQPPYGE